MSEVIVVGSGGHARVLVGIARRDGGFLLIGYVDVQDRGVRHGLSFLGPDECLRTDHAESKLLLGVGLMDDAMSRWRVYTTHKAHGKEFITLVSSRACIGADVHFGAGTVVMDQSAVNAGTELGEACIVNTGAVVEHDCRLGNNVHVAPNATVCGGVRVEDHCLIGAGATIIPGVRVATKSLIGAGAVVAGDIERPGTYLGVPAKRCGEGMP